MSTPEQVRDLARQTYDAASELAGLPTMTEELAAKDAALAALQTKMDSARTKMAALTAADAAEDQARADILADLTP